MRALQAGADAVEPWEATRRTLAEGLRVPKLAGGRLVMRALRETDGMAQAVSESQLLDALRRTAASDGLLLGAEGAVAIAAIAALRKLGQLEGADVLAFNTASAYKSPETLAAAGVG